MKKSQFYLQEKNNEFGISDHEVNGSRNFE
jgi:hypothetical protein